MYRYLIVESPIQGTRVPPGTCWVPGSPVPGPNNTPSTTTTVVVVTEPHTRASGFIKYVNVSPLVEESSLSRFNLPTGEHREIW